MLGNLGCRSFRSANWFSGRCRRTNRRLRLIARSGTRNIANAGACRIKFADGLDPALVARIEETCKRIYRLLTIDGYARLDLRLTPNNEIYFIEANPNPILAEDEDFAQVGGQSRPALSAIDRSDHPAGDEYAPGLRLGREFGGTRRRVPKSELTRRSPLYLQFETRN